MSVHAFSRSVNVMEIDCFEIKLSLCWIFGATQHCRCWIDSTTVYLPVTWRWERDSRSPGNLDAFCYKLLVLLQNLVCDVLTAFTCEESFLLRTDVNKDIVLCWTQ